MALPLFVIRHGQLSFVLTATAIILGDLGLVSLILYILLRNGEPASRASWTWRHPLRELILGVVYFCPGFPKCNAS